MEVQKSLEKAKYGNGTLLLSSTVSTTRGARADPRELSHNLVVPFQENPIVLPPALAECYSLNPEREMPIGMIVSSLTASNRVL